LINGKQKGNGFERLVARTLTEWAGGLKFERVPQSGGLHWQEDNNVSGDIVPPFNIGFPGSIECKKVETDWEIDKLLTGTSDIWKWWEQCLRDSKEHGSKFPLLVFTKNRRKIYIALEESLFELLKEKFGQESSDFYLLPHIRVNINKGKKIVVVDFDLFLSSVTLEQFLSLKELCGIKRKPV
jgi:hypothetical protein